MLTNTQLPLVQQNIYFPVIQVVKSFRGINININDLPACLFMFWKSHLYSHICLPLNQCFEIVLLSLWLKGRKRLMQKSVQLSFVQCFRTTFRRALVIQQVEKQQALKRRIHLTSVLKSYGALNNLNEPWGCACIRLYSLRLWLRITNVDLMLVQENTSEGYIILKAVIYSESLCPPRSRLLGCRGTTDKLPHMS